MLLSFEVLLYDAEIILRRRPFRQIYGPAKVSTGYMKEFITQLCYQITGNQKITDKVITLHPAFVAFASEKAAA